MNTDKASERFFEAFQKKVSTCIEKETYNFFCHRCHDTHGVREIVTVVPFHGMHCEHCRLGLLCITAHKYDRFGVVKEKCLCSTNVYRI